MSCSLGWRSRSAQKTESASSSCAVRPSKNTPPVLVLDGLAFRSYLRIPNLFLPIGMALHPPLRRDAVIKLLAEDKTRITWLAPHSNAGFTPESLPDDAFRPLPEWVDYVLEHDHQALQTWLGATQFQFESFICRDDVTKAKRPPKGSGPKQPREEEETVAKSKAIDVVEKKKPTPAPTVATEASVPPGEVEKRLRDLEGAYQALTTPLEDAGRQAIWREMAVLNGGNESAQRRSRLLEQCAVGNGSDADRLAARVVSRGR